MKAQFWSHGAALLASISKLIQYEMKATPFQNHAQYLAAAAHAFLHQTKPFKTNLCLSLSLSLPKLLHFPFCVSECQDWRQQHSLLTNGELNIKECPGSSLSSTPRCNVYDEPDNHNRTRPPPPPRHSQLSMGIVQKIWTRSRRATHFKELSLDF